MALAALLSGCVAGVDARIDLVFDPCATRIVAAPDVTARQLASIDRALVLWNDAAGLALERVAEPPSATVLEVSFVPTIAALRGVYDDEVGAIMVNRDIQGDEERTLTIAHELGHAFGLHHVPLGERASLMNPGDVRVPPTPADVDELLEFWGDCRGE